MASYTEGPDRPLVAQNCEDLKATRSGFSFQTTIECSECHLQWKESEVVRFNGKYFGIPCGCSKDVPQLASKGRK